MPSRPPDPVLLALACPLLFALGNGCGGGGASQTASSGIAGHADPADVRVIDGWVTALRRGDVGAAAGYFALPSVAENGPFLVHIRTLHAARRFNESLPCGA